MLIYAADVAPVRSAPHARRAQEFCNRILRAGVQVQLMEKALLGPTNATVKVAKQLAEAGVPDAELVKRSFFVAPNFFTENRQAYTREVDFTIGM